MSFSIRKSVMLAVLFMLPLMGCQVGSQDRSSGPQAKVDPVQEANEIQGLEREWSRRFQAKDVDWIMGLYTDESRHFPPDGEPVIGREALRAAWEGMVHTKGLQIIWEPTAARVSDSGDLAYDFGTVVTFSPEGRRTEGKYLVVWVREGETWKVSVDMFNENGPPAM